MRQITGCERARYEDPIAGGLGNSMRYFRFANCSNTTQAAGETTNIFCAGEKLGAMVGHTEAIVTGSLAGHNAARHAAGKPLLTLPDSLAVGDFVNHVIGEMKRHECRGTKYTFSGSVYFERMKGLGLYTTDIGEIEERVRASGLSGIMGKTVI